MWRLPKLGRNKTSEPMPEAWRRLSALLYRVYPESQAEWLLARLQERLGASEAVRSELTQQDVLLIAYADHVQHSDYLPLRALHRFCAEQLEGMFSALHILPFYPSSSDDGYSVTDFKSVDPRYGSWGDIERLHGDFQLMFDLPLNHVSASHPWFHAFLTGDDTYRDYFITLPPDTDVSRVVRPRSHPLLSKFHTSLGRRHVWTTFSRDQIDLNYANPEVLREMIEVLLTYTGRSADYIRLDAVGFLWKQAHTRSLHMPQTHLLVQVLRAVLDIAAPQVQLITETNVPSRENITYFGDGQHEAQLVYNFALPPLLLHAIHVKDARVLSEWAATLSTPSKETTFCNFTASHDGIGLRPVEDILNRNQITDLTTRVQERGGVISYRSNPDGSLGPYELNISYCDAVSDPREDPVLSVRKFMLTQAIMLALPGVPAVYFSSLLAAPSWPEGVSQRGYNRAINRQKFPAQEGDGGLTLTQLQTGASRADYALRSYRRLLLIRRRESAFHPQASHRVLYLNPAVFCLQRINHENVSTILALHNMSGSHQTCQLPAGSWQSLLTGEDYTGTVELPPYHFRWLKLATSA